LPEDHERHRGTQGGGAGLTIGSSSREVSDLLEFCKPDLANFDY